MEHFRSDDDRQLRSQLCIDEETDEDPRALSPLPEERSHLESLQAPYSPPPAPAGAIPLEVSSAIKQPSLSIEQHQNKRKASSMSDNEAQHSRARKKQNSSTHEPNVPVPSSKGSSQQPPGKLKRPSKPVQDNATIQEDGDFWAPPVDALPMHAEDLVPEPGNGSIVSKPQSEEVKKSPAKKRGRPKKADAAKAPPQQTQPVDDSPRHTRSRQANKNPKGSPVTSERDVALSRPIPLVHREPPPRQQTKVKLSAQSAQSRNHEEVGNNEDAQQDDAEHGLDPSGSAYTENSKVDAGVSDPDLPDTTVEPTSQKACPDLEHTAAPSDPANLSDAVLRASSKDTTPDKERRSRDAQDLTVRLEEPRPELFGLDDHWRKIIEASKSIGVSTVGGVKSKRKPDLPELSTDYISNLISLIEDLTGLYSTIPDCLSSSASAHDFIEHLQECLETIEVYVSGLSESEFQGQEEGIVQDVYAHAIPKMVVLLDEALKARRALLLKKSKVDVLEEIISIQELLTDLCGKARGWKAKPPVDKPIMRSSMSIRPPLKALLKAFNAILNDRRRRLEWKTDSVKARQLEEERTQEALEEAQRKLKAQEARNRLIHQALVRMEAETRPARPLRQPQPQSQEPQRRTDKNSWSREQDQVLLKEIFAAEYGDLPGRIFAYHHVRR
ncbi:MAG: hypothetical protein Q9207_005495 [Kuettlingeria erythrocarpa]